MLTVLFSSQGQEVGLLEVSNPSSGSLTESTVCTVDPLNSVCCGHGCSSPERSRGFINKTKLL